ncbi:unnamed protein product [Brassica oleracea]
MYLTIDNLLWVRNKLYGTPEMEKLMGSCFGSLFKIPYHITMRYFKWFLY